MKFIRGFIFGAREGDRTLVSSLEGLCSTTELLSRKKWAEEDSNPRSDSATDLQSVPVDRLGICP